MLPASTPATLTSRQIRDYARRRAWCEWDGFEHWQPLISAAMADPTGAAWPPFHLLGLPGIDADEQRVCAERWTAGRLADSAVPRAEAALQFAQSPPRASGRPLRIGYLSCDFHQHATALLLIEALEAHDPARFELHAYCHGHDDGLALRQRLRAVFTGFHDIGHFDDAQAAQQIHADGIDILVDLKGYTAGSRSMLLAWRPAPIQVSFLGYPGTLGGTLADYLIADRYIAPLASATHYSEALACLPYTYQPHARHTDLDAAPTRTASGLPEGGVVFCCFNQAWKLTPAVFDVWCRILADVPGSVLWLLQDNQAQGNLRQEALARGIAPHRLVFADDAKQAQHLARLQLADLVLDTWPYNAHTTASDALAAGVPLLTLAGDTFAGRVAGSLLHAVGLPELVTHHTEAYAALAVGLGNDPAALQQLKAKLAHLAPQAALFDVPGYTRQLEALYTAMWSRHTAGLPPQALDTAAA